jgi:hypothetical protein
MGLQVSRQQSERGPGQGEIELIELSKFKSTNFGSPCDWLWQSVEETLTSQFTLQVRGASVCVVRMYVYHLG